MTERPPLDLDRLAVSTVPLQLWLVLSTVVGLAMGIGIIIVASFAVTMAMPLGFIGLIIAMVATGVAASQLILMGLAAAVVIPLAAIAASRLRLRFVESYVLDDFRASRADPNSRIGQVLAELSRRAGLSQVPRYGVVENAFNAFAISSSRSAGLVMLRKPLLMTLKPMQTAAILGHEIGHVAMDDCRRKYLAMAHQEFLSSFLVFAGLKRIGRTILGFVGNLALAAHSREREYWADAVGAYVTSKQDMISALEAIHGMKSRPTSAERDYAPLMFSPVAKLFPTHPSAERRIAALENETYLRRLPIRKPTAEPKADAITNVPPAASYEGI